MTIYTGRKTRWRGATSVELALVVPIIIVLIFGAIDFARYSTARGILESSVQQAASLSSVISNLDNEGGIWKLTQSGPGSEIIERVGGEDNCPSTNGELCEEQLRALQSINEKILDIAKIGGLDFQSTGTRITEFGITLPELNSGTKLVDRLEKEPIIVHVKGKFAALLPMLGEIDFDVKAVTFREIRKGATMPLALDCNGNLPGEDTAATNCPCPTAPGDQTLVWSSDTNSCICRPDAGLIEVAALQCSCANSNMVFDAAQRRCVCPDCPTDNYLQNEATCGCSCPIDAGVVNGDCRCPDGAEPINGVCSCPTGQIRCRNTGECVPDCSEVPNTFYDRSTCQCTCDTGVANRMQCEDGRCVNTDNCPSAGEFDPESCACNCPEGLVSAISSDGTVACVMPCPEGSTIDGDLRRCICDADTSRTCPFDSEMTDPASCNCDCRDGGCNFGGECRYPDSCPPPMQFGGVNPDGSCAASPGVSHCVCPPGTNMCFSGDGLTCRTCTNGTLDFNSCSCDCPKGYQLCGMGSQNQQCVPCENGILNENCQCVCPVGSVLCNSGVCLPCTGGTPDLASCTCGCPPGQTYCNGGCFNVSCPEEATVNLGSCGCICPQGRSFCNNGCNTIPCNGGVVDNNCICQCGSGKSLCNGSCVSCIGGTVNPATCQCECPNGTSLCNGECRVIPCGGGTVNGCSCQCPAGQVLCNGNCVPSCTSGAALDANCQCQCPGNSWCNNGTCKVCQSPLTLNAATCECACQSPNQLCNDACLPPCADPLVRNPLSCTCECPQGYAYCPNTSPPRCESISECRPEEYEVFDPQECACRCQDGYEQSEENPDVCIPPRPAGCEPPECIWNGQDWEIPE